jgi:hypothetical protein
MRQSIVVLFTFFVLHSKAFAFKEPGTDRKDKRTKKAPADTLPSVFNKNNADLIESTLRNEAVLRFASFQLPNSKAEWEKYRADLKSTIIKKAGIQINHNLAFNTKETGSIKMNGYTIKNIAFQTQPGVYTTANLFIPDGKGPFPASIVMMGHNDSGKLANRYQSIGHTLARNGYVALTVDPWGSGERSTIHGKFEYHGSLLGAALMNVGESLMGLQVTDNIRGVDLLASLPYVDASKIGATGASGGGNQTMWVTAIDDRIKAAVPVVSVGTFESYVMRHNCICELLIDGLTFTEEAGILALAAPRAIKMFNHNRDLAPSFFPTEMQRSYTNAKPIFNLYGVPNNIGYQLFDLPHGYWAEDREAMLGWLDLHLKGVGSGEPKKEVEFSILPKEQLMTFMDGERDANVESTETFCKRVGNELRTSFLNTKIFNVENKRNELRNVLRINEKSVLKGVNKYSSIDGWVRYSLQTFDDKMIPVLIQLASNKPAHYTIVCNPGGKQSISTALLNELAAKGQGIVIVDLSGTGEALSTLSRGDDDRGKLHTLSRAELWLGKTVIGEWVKELETISRFLISNLNAISVQLDGTREAGLAALFLSAIQPKLVKGVTVRETPVSYLFDNKENINYFSMGVHLPGILKWGDISLAAALAGNTINFINPVSMSGQAITGSRLQEYRKEFEKMRAVTKQTGRIIL